jgi:hypothetical protein
MRIGICTVIPRLLAFLAFAIPASVTVAALTASAQLPPDPGWPRVFKKDGKQLTVHQPQVDRWNGYTNIQFRCAIAVQGVLAEERFGVAEIDAVTVTDPTARIVALVPTVRDLRFPKVTDAERASLVRAVDELNPPGRAITLGLDRVIAYLDPAHQAVQRSAEVSLAPPQIFHSSTPAVLVMFMGEPKLMPVETNRTDLLFALNTNWDLLYDTANQRYYLLNGEGWLTTTDLVKGPWTPISDLPPSLYSLPSNDNWNEVRNHLPGKPAKSAPRVFVSTQPAEMILTEGAPSYLPVRGTRLLRVNNTASTLFLHTGDGKMYFLVAGRWFRGGSLDGPWSAASADLPSDFARIPDEDPLAFVKASVPGTREAADAVLLASIPTTTAVSVTNTIQLNVTYSGVPQFVTITNTVVQYAVNTPKQVFLVSGRYYCCDQGVWLESAMATGPWVLCSSVPAALYTIPPSNPNYNVTYVTVQSSTPSTVTYSQTSGYSGEYVASTGVLMFGAGMLVGAAIANNNDNHYYYPPYPCHYSYGCGATYHYGYGGYHGASYQAYGPYGGAGYSAGYNPSTGTYARSSYAYGPYGSASRSAAYNPYSGTYAANAQVHTAYGSAGRSASYSAASGQYSASAYRSSAYGSASAQANFNAYTGDASASRQASTAYGSASRGAAYDAQTGARAAGGQVSTAQGSAGRAAAYNPTTGQGAAGGYVSGQYGSAGAVTTTSGSSAAAWETQQGQGAAAKSASGDVYASNGDTVYKKDSSGNWSQNSGSGWESTQSPQQQAQAQASATQQQAQSQAAAKQQQAQSQASATQQQRAASGSTTATTTAGQHASSMESQAQARSWGNQQSQRSTQYQSSASRSGGGRSGGGRR